jgi:hypothetical protein
MGLTLADRKAVTKTIATRYPRAHKAGKGRVLDQLCATTGWHRNHARKALKAALRPTIARPRRTPSHVDRAHPLDHQLVLAVGNHFRLHLQFAGPPTESEQLQRRLAWRHRSRETESLTGMLVATVNPL